MAPRHPRGYFREYGPGVSGDWVSGFVDDALVGFTPGESVTEAWVSGFVEDAILPKANTDWVSGFVDNAIALAGTGSGVTGAWVSGFVDNAIAFKADQSWVTEQIAAIPDPLIDHDALTGVQGGTAGQHYHLTYDERAAVQGISGFVDNAVAQGTTGLVNSGFVDQAIVNHSVTATQSGFISNAVTQGTAGLVNSAFVDNAIVTHAVTSTQSGFISNAVTQGTAGLVNSAFVDQAITTHAVTNTQSGFVDNAIVTHSVTSTQSGFVDNAIAGMHHNVLLGVQGGSTNEYFHLTEDALDALESSSASGRLWGGIISATATPNNVSVAAGAGVAKTSSATLETVPTAAHDGQSSPADLVTWPATQVTLAGVGYNIIFWDTSAGQFTSALKENFYAAFDFTRDFTVGRVYYDGSAVTIRLCGMNLWNFARRVQMFGEERFPVERATGMMIAATTGLGFSITSGRLWAELVNPFSVAAFTTDTHTFTYWYSDGGAGWTSVATQNAISNLLYDDGSGTLATLANNKYGVHWVFEMHNGSVHVVYGTSSYTLAEAELATPPTTLPGILAAYATLGGKIIVAKSASTLLAVQSTYTQQFASSTVTSHNDLSGLQGGTTNEYYHLTSAEHTAVQGFSGFVDNAVAQGTAGLVTSGWVDQAIVNHAVTPTVSGFVDQAILSIPGGTPYNDSWISGFVDTAIVTHSVTPTVSGFVDNAVAQGTAGFVTSGWVDQAITTHSVTSIQSGFISNAVTQGTAGLVNSGWVDQAITTHSVTAIQSGFVDQAITTHAVTAIQSGWVDNAIVKHSITAVQSGFVDNAIASKVSSGFVDNAIVTHAVTPVVSGYIDNAITYRTPVTLPLTAAPANQSYTGITAPFTYGESLTFGDVVYVKSDGAVWKADANAAGLYPAVGIAVETAASGTHLVLLQGIVRSDALFNLTVGGVLYLSTTAGALTQTQPAATDDVIQILGVATHADRVFFRPDLTWITHT